MGTHANRTVSKDELILLNAGEYEEVYVAGLFRATRDIDFDAATASYLASVPHARLGFDAPDLPAVAFGIDPRSSDPLERGFIAWLGEQGMIERIPTVAVNLAGGFAAADGTPVLQAQVTHHDPEPDPGMRP
jgi:hypothetical protein